MSTGGQGVAGIFRPAFMLMAGRAAGFAVAFAIPIVLVRMFDQADFGTYKQLFLIYTTLFPIAQVGLAESLYYFLPGAHRDAGRYLANAVTGLMLVGALCLAGLWVLRPEIGHWLNNTTLTPYLPLLGLYLLFMLGAAVLEIGMTARKHHMQTFAAYALSDLMRAALSIAPVLLFGGLTALLVGSVAFAMLRFGVTLWYLRAEFTDGIKLDLTLFGRQLAYALPYALAILIHSAQQNLHMYAVSYRYDAAVFAVYAVGCLQVPLVEFMMTSTSSVMMVRMREQLHAGDRAAVLELWNDTTRKLALVFIPLVGVLLVCADRLIDLLFTAKYADSTPLFRAWSLTILLSALMTDSVLRVFAETRFLIGLYLVRLLYIAGTIGWALSEFGLMGAVLSTLAATLIANGIALARMRSLLQSGLKGLLPWKALASGLAIGALAAVPALLVKGFLAMPDLPALMIIGTAYGATYLGLLWFFGPLNGDERFALVALARRPVTRAWPSPGV